MRQILKKLGFHRPDEMEEAIRFKAQRNAYTFLIIALLIWSLYECYTGCVYHSGLNPFPGFLLAMAVVIQVFSRLIMTRNAVKDDEDSHESGPLVGMIVLTCVVIGIIAAALSVILLMGARI